MMASRVAFSFRRLRMLAWGTLSCFVRNSSNSSASATAPSRSSYSEDRYWFIPITTAKIGVSLSLVMTTCQSENWGHWSKANLGNIGEVGLLWVSWWIPQVLSGWKIKTYWIFWVGMWTVACEGWRRKELKWKMSKVLLKCRCQILVNLVERTPRAVLNT